MFSVTWLEGDVTGTHTFVDKSRDVVPDVVVYFWFQMWTYNGSSEEIVNYHEILYVRYI